MIRFSRLLLCLTLTGLATLPAVAASSHMPGGLAATSHDHDDDDSAVSAEGFSIVPPEGWEEGNPSDKMFMVYLEPGDQKFHTNFNVNISDDDGVDVHQLGAMLKPEYAKQFQKWKAMYDGVTTIGGEDAYYLSSAFTMSGLNIQNLQYFIRGKNKRFYVLTFTALANQYKDYEAAFKAAAESVETTED